MKVGKKILPDVHYRCRRSRELRFILKNFRKRDSMIDLVHKDVMS